MSVQFEDNSYNPVVRRYAEQRQAGGITGFLIRKGVIKNQSQANVLLVVLAFIFLVAAFYIYKLPGRTIESEADRIQQERFPATGGSVYYRPQN